MNRRARRVTIGALLLAAAGVAVTAGMLAVTIPVSWRYEVSDILAHMRSNTWQFRPWSEPILMSEAEKLKTVATLVQESCGADNGGLQVLPHGTALIVTGTTLQHWDVVQIMRSLRSAKW